jgi:pyruvate dehydrogenase E2 component (dihydrolipoamide acetyltransferase)
MALEFKLPDIGEGIHEGEIVQWLVQPGDTVKEDQPLVEVMTDKVTAEIPSPAAGVVRSLHGKPGEVVKVGSVIVVLDDVGAAAPSAPTPVAATPVVNGTASAPVPSYGQSSVGATAVAVASPPVRPAVGNGGGRVLAAPATRKLARQLGVDLSVIAGSGPRGRVTPSDVRNATAGGSSKQAAPSVHRPAAPVVPIAPGAGDRRVPFTGIRKKIAEHLVHAKQTAPHFAYVEEVDMSEIVRLRDQLLPEAEAQGVKLTYLPFIIKAVIAALKAFPILNSSLDEATQELVYKGQYNIGVATATDSGLVVPVVHNADRLNLLELAQTIKALSEKARTGKLSLDEMRGGTFTVTSIGSIGGLFGIPIINYPEVAILGVNKISKRPVVRNDEIVIREMMHLSISCDHRVVDGAEAALYVKKLIEYLETPGKLLLV